MKKNKFYIGQDVYHVTPESGKGIVIDITYTFSTGTYHYLVATSWDVEHMCVEHELSDSQIF